MIAIIKYTAGNIKSVQNALTIAGYKSVITDKDKEILNADKVIIPGVGEAGSAMRYLKERGLDKLICTLKQPVLGICLGLQLMCISSEENNTQCMGIFDTIVRKFPPLDKVPHMGWNNFISIDGKIFDGISTSDDVYYVHSYYTEVSSYTIATCQYIIPFSAAMRKNNFYAVQFHPEKSADTGVKILNNFLKL
jgi:imidazole glycerol-phosphate synthase subunit HisH